jgi:hypothetical protein
VRVDRLFDGMPQSGSIVCVCVCLGETFAGFSAWHKFTTTSFLQVTLVHSILVGAARPSIGSAFSLCTFPVPMCFIEDYMFRPYSEKNCIALPIVSASRLYSLLHLKPTGC